MWLVDFLPNWIIHGVVVTSALAMLASLFLKMIPFIGKNFVFINFISAIALCFGVWLEGGIAMKEEYKAAIAHLQLQIANAEKESARLNHELEIERREKIDLTRSVGESVRQALKAHTKEKLDPVCTFDDETIRMLNEMAEDPLKGKKK